MVVAHYKKDDLLNCWTSSLDISGYHADFHEGHGMAGERHGHGMLCVNRPLKSVYKCCPVFKYLLSYGSKEHCAGPDTVLMSFPYTAVWLALF